MKLGHWTSKTLPAKDDIGFCYKITCKLTGKYYYGSKVFQRKCGKGKLRKPDWEQYCSSSKTLQKLIEQLGKSKFRFQILSFHRTKSDLHYNEAKLILTDNALLDENCINEFVYLKIRTKLKKIL